MPIELPRIIQKVTVVTDDAGYKQFIRSVDEGTEALEEHDKALGDVEKSASRTSKSTESAAKSHRSYASSVRDARKETEGSIRATSLLRNETDKGDASVRRATAGWNAHSSAMRKAHSDHDRLGKDLHKIRGQLHAAGQAGAAFIFGLVGKIPALIAGVSLASQGISALSAGLIALTQSITPLFNLIGLLPAAITAAVGGLGALLIAAKPVGEALGAAFKEPGKTGGGGGETARQRARRLADAIKDVERAQESLSDSQRDAERAQIELNEAYLDATENLRDLRQEQDRGSISVQRAEIAIGRAKENQLKISADSTATESDRLEALLDVKDAELDLKDAQEKRVDLARDLHEAEKQGVEGSDAVRDAAERQSDALTAVVDAQLALTRAIEDQKSPEKATGAAAAVDEYAEALKNLSPEARKFVETIRAQKGLFKDLRTDVQDALFGPLNQGLAGLFAQAGPIKQFFTESAAGIGDLGKSIATAFSGEELGADLRILGVQTGDIFRALAEPLTDLIGIFTDLAVVGGPFLVQIIEGIGNATGGFANKISDLRESGDLARIFAEGIERVKQFGRIIADVFGGLRNIFHAASGLADSFVRSMETGAQRFKDITGSVSGQNKLADWFASAKAPLDEFFGLLGDVFKLFIDIGAQETLTSTIARIRDEGLPILQTILSSVGPKFVDAVLDLAFAFGNFFSQIAGQSGPLMAIVGAFTALFDVLSWALRNIPGLKEVVTVLIALKAAMTVGSLALSVSGIGKMAGGLSTLIGLTPKLKEAGTTIGDLATVGKTGSIGAVGAALGGLGPQIAIIAGIAAAAATASYFFGKWKDRKEDLDKIRKGFIEGLKDEKAKIEDVATAVAQAHLERKNQDDDLIRAGLTYEKLGDALVGGQENLRDIRQSLLDTGEIVLTQVGRIEGATFGTEEAMRRARDQFLKTGEVLPGFVSSNDGLVRSMKDLVEQADLAADEELNRLQATGQVTAAQVLQVEQMLKVDAAIQGLDPTLVGHTQVLETVRAKIKEVNDAYQTSIDKIKEIEDNLLSGIGTERRRDKAVKETAKAQDAVTKATLEFLAADAKGTPEERAEAAERLAAAVEAHEDSILAQAEANKAYLATQATVVDADADLATQREQQGKRTHEIADGLLADLERERAALSAEGMDTTFIDKVIEDIKTADLSVIVEAQLQFLPVPSVEGTTIPVKGNLVFDTPLTGFQSPIAGEAARARALTSGQAAAGYGFGQAAAAPPRPAAPTVGGVAPIEQGAPGSKRYLPAYQDPNRRPGYLQFPGIGSTQFKYDKSRKMWYIQFARGGILPRMASGGYGIGGGFMTNGPRAIVGEGKRQWPEFVIPTDPAYRDRAHVLVKQLMDALHMSTEFGMTMQGLDNVNAAAGPAAWPTLTPQSAEPSIGRSVGYEQNFAGATFMVQDYDDFMEQMAAERRRANMAAVSSGRSPKR